MRRLSAFLTFICDASANWLAGEGVAGGSGFVGLDDQAVGEEAGQGSVALCVVGPDSVQAGAGDAALGVPEDGHQAAADLAVGAGPGLAAPRRSVVRRAAGGGPCAQLVDRACLAARAGR